MAVFRRSELTLSRVLRDRVERDGERDGFVFLSYGRAGAPEAARLSYGEFLGRAQAIAATLQAAGGQGERVLILCPPGLDYIAAFFACQLAGQVAVPAYPPRNARHMGRLQEMIADAGASAILVSSALSGRLADWADGQEALPRRIAIEAIPADAAASWRDPNPRADNLAFLQYTSGTIGQPKGVMVNHNQVLENIGHIVSLTGLEPSAVGASWLPPYHDMGLVGGLLVPVSAGFLCVLMSPTAFLLRPGCWLEAMTEYRATITAAPNFAYQRCVDDIPEEGVDAYDLTALRHALCGAETVRFSTLKAFSVKFARCGFRYERFVPVYGMAETVLLTAGRLSPRGPKALILDAAALAAQRVAVQGHIDGGTPLSASAEPGWTTVSCGPVIAGHDLHIVDPVSRQELPEGSLGEIWIAGPNVTAGYWNKPEVSEATFGCRLGDAPNGRPYLRTGDLGTVIAGEVYILGRLKDQLIIRGRNHYSEDIEATAAGAHEILKPDRAAAFGVEVGPEGLVRPGDSQGREECLVLVQELGRTALRRLDPEAVCVAIRQAILQQHEIDPQAIVLISPASLPRTTSGKIQRARARELFLAGELAEVARWERCPQGRERVTAPPEDWRPAAVERWLQALVAQVTGVSAHEVPPDQALSELGMDSLLAVRLLARLAEATGKELPLRAVFEHPTVEGLAGVLAGMEKGEFTAIARADRSQPLPLSYQQERLWFLDRLQARAGAAYNIVGAFKLRGKIDVGALKGALEAVVRRHESLRTHFGVEDGQPVQVIGEAGGFTLLQEDIASLDEKARRARVEALMLVPFDLARGPLFRASLLRLDGRTQVLVVGGHHTVLDGWSVGLLLGEVSALYRERVLGAAAALPELPIQYADYAAWQRAVLCGERLETETAYWREQLAGAPQAISLPFDRGRAQEADYRGGAVAVHLPAALTERLTALGRAQGATLFMVLEAAFAVLLHRVGGDQDLVIGTAVAGRSRVELEPLAGFFVNTLALRHRLDPEQGFTALLAQSQRLVLDAFEHASVPFEAVVEAVQPVRSLSHQPLVQVMFVLQNTPVFDASASLELPGVSVEAFAPEAAGAQFELSLTLSETPEGLQGTLGYATQLFERASIERLVGMYRRLLMAAVQAPESKIAALPLMDEAERRQVVEAFNATAEDYPRAKTVVDLFAEQAAQWPAKVAVIDAERALGYGELDEASNRLARHLIGLGVGPEVVVGVCLERSVELIVALLGILKAGGAYLPLDADYPEARLGFMLADAKAALVLSTEALAPRLPGAYPTLLLDAPQTATAIAALCAGPLTQAERLAPLTPETLAYVIYTSGSTGKPKGVGVAHRQAAHLAAYQADWVLEEGCQRLALFASIAFDASVSEMLMAFACAGALVVVPEAARLDGARLADFLQAMQIDAITLPPQVAEALVHAEGLPLRVLITAGEPALAQVVQALAPRLRYINAYGPTETTVCASAAHLRAGDPISIGAPIANTQVYVLDAHLNAQPIGVVGELFIGGVQVARGYLGRAALSAERFIADPFSGIAGARLYRTGDLGRWRADGTLEFLGRADFQVKIRGMRVEPGEIEAVLQGCQGIAQAVVVGREAGAGDTRLVAYVVPAELPEMPEALDEAACARVHVLALEGLLDLEAVRAALRRRLPEHMVPARFVGLSRLPLSVSGKVDRRGLPQAEEVLARATYVAPRTEAECQVAEAFAALLNVPEVGVHDGFFDLDGHSLLAVRLLARLAEATGKELPLRAVFEHPTVEGLAGVLAGMEKGEVTAIARADRSRCLPLSSAQERVLAIESMAPGHGALNSTAVFRLKGPLDTTALATALRTIVDRHEVLRTHFERQAEQEAFRPVIEAAGDFRLEVRRLSNEDQDKVDAIASVEARRPIDPCSGPIFRSLLLLLGEEEAVLVVGAHHIAIDAVSFGILWEELKLVYESLVRKEPVTLEPVGFQYVDYAAWEREQLSPSRVAALTTWWREQLAGAPAFVNLPFDRARPAALSRRGGTVHRRLRAELVASLKRLAAVQGATPFIVLESCLALLCCRLARSREILIGTVSEGRRHRAFERSIGFFINTLALRHRLRADHTAAALIAETRETLVLALEHDLLPYAKVVAALNPPRSPAFDPLFQVFCQLRAAPLDERPRLGEASVEAMEQSGGERGAELAVIFDQHPEVIDATFSYASDLFDAASMECLADLYLALLEQMTSAPDAPVDALFTDALAALGARLSDSARAGVLVRLTERPEAATGAWYPLSSAQRMLWLKEQASPQEVSFYSVAMMVLPPSVERSRLVAAAESVIERFQTSCLELSPQGFQREHAGPPRPPSRIPVGTLATPERRMSILLEWHNERDQRHEGSALYEVAIFEAADGVVVAGRSHHLIMDGWAVFLFFDAITKAYSGYSGKVNASPGPSSLFLPTLRSDQLYQWSDAYARARSFWQEALTGDVGTPLIHALSDRAATGSEQSTGTCRRNLPPSLVAGLSDVAEALSVSPGEFLTAVVATYLAKMTGTKRFVLSVPFMNRTKDTLRTPGHFVNILPVPVAIEPAAPFEATVTSVSERLRAANQHGRFPYDEIVRRTGLDPRHGDVAVNTLFLRRGLVLDGASIPMHWVSGPELGLSFLVTQFGADTPVELELRFNAVLFEEQTIARHISRFVDYLERICTLRKTPIRAIPVMGEAERRQVVEAFNATAEDYPREKTMVDLFAEQARKWSAKVAVIEAERALSYGELERASNRLARHLIGLGVGPEVVVGVCLERSVELIVALLGILKAGGAYLPLDAHYPQARLGFMLADAKAALVLSSAALAPRLPGAYRKLLLDAPQTEIAFASHSASPLSQSERFAPLTPQTLAYVIYTSGSTGKPKGVGVAHRQAAHLAAYQADWVLEGGCQRVGLFASIAFDASVSEMLMAFTGAGALVVVPEAARLDGARLADFLQAMQIDAITLPPQVAEALVYAEGLPLRVLITAGEPALAQVVQALAPRLRYINAYGPTETTVCATAAHLRAGDPISIGAPVANTQVYVLDAHLNPQPIGVVGELFIGGVQVARGYLDRPALTAQQFIADPFSKVPGERLYRTGDLGRWRADGTLEFLGRADFQVKIRGMRVEPGEIEAVLQACEGIAQAVVACEAGEGDTRLVAYIVPAEPPAGCDEAGAGDVQVLGLEVLPDLEAVRAALRRQLPEHMVPARFVGLSRLPLSASGKVDRRGLPQAEEALSRATYVAPRTDAERLVAKAFAELLKVSPVGVHDGFFDLGGHSLLAVRLVARLAEATGKEVPIRAVFEHPTVEGLARALSDQNNVLAPTRDIAEHIHLTEGYVPGPGDLPENIARSAGVLLTGATGFLGRYLAQQLFVRGCRKIVCLVRADDQSRATERMCVALKQAGLQDAVGAIGSRILPLAGDIVKPHLGLDDTRYKELSQQVDMVLHNAAEVNFFKSYEELKPANVESVRKLLALCAVGRRKAFHFVSTLSVFGPQDFRDAAVTETTPPHKPGSEQAGYAQGKWVAEQILALARNRGFSVNIYRPSLIVGDSASGYYDTNDMGAAFMQLALELGATPKDDTRSIWVVPVDQAARRIVALVDDPASRGNNYHITDWPGVSLRSIQQAAAHEGLPLVQESPATWTERAKVLMSQQPGHGAAWLAETLPNPTQKESGATDKGFSPVVSAFAPPRLPQGISMPTVEETHKALVAALRWMCLRSVEGQRVQEAARDRLDGQGRQGEDSKSGMVLNGTLE